MDCDNCEKPKVCPDDCGMYQDLQGIYESVLNELAKTNDKTKDLEGKYLELKKWYDWLLNAYFME